MSRHNKERKERAGDVPEIFHDLWNMSFVTELNFSRAKGELLPKIRVTIDGESEEKVKALKALLQKYEFPFSNLKIVSSPDKKEAAAEEKPDCHACACGASKPAVPEKIDKNKSMYAKLSGQGKKRSKNDKPLLKVNSSRFKFKSI